VTGANFIPAQTGTSVVTYAFTGQNGCTGTASNLITVDACSGISENSKTDVIVYPNPTRALLTVQSTSQIISVIISDIRGEVIHKMIGISQKPEIDLSFQSAGVYIIEVFTLNGPTHARILKVD
jgi:hypothetical protein